MDEWLEISALIEKVQELYDLGLFDKGKELLERYKDVYHDEWEIYFLLSRAYSEQNQPELAIENLKHGLRLDKNNLDCLLGLFYAYTQMNQLRKAIRYLKIAKKLYPNNDLILNALIWYYTETNNLSKAISCYESASSILDYNPEALRNIGIAYERSGNFNKALTCFKMSLELNPGNEETLDLLADHYIFRGEIKKSIKLYKNHLAKSPNNIRAMSRLVYCFLQDGQIEESEKTALDIISIYPNFPSGYVDLSYIYLNSNRIDKAIKTAQKALDVSPIDPEALRIKGIAYSELKNNHKADESFKAALSLAPKNPEIMRDYYHHLRNSERYDEMEKMIFKVVDLEYPYCTEDYWFLADYYKDKKDNIKAFHYLLKAYRSMPGEKELLPPMAEILFDKGHQSFAVNVLKRYIETRGWNEVMKALTKQKRLQGKWTQEGLRFLQFYGQNRVEFRKFIFAVYVKKCIFISLYALLASLLIPVYIYFDIKGAGAVFILCVLIGFLTKATVTLLKKRLFFLNHAFGHSHSGNT